MSKINKLGKSSVVIAILSFLLVAVLAFGGTYAYFSDSSKVEGSDVTLGTLVISKDTAWTDDATVVTKGEIVVPNQVIANSDVTAKVKSNINYYVRIKIVTDYSLATGHDCDAEGMECTQADKDLDTPILFTLKWNNGTADEVLLDPENDEVDDTGLSWWIGAVDVDDTDTTISTQYLYLKDVQEPNDDLTEANLAELKVNIKAQVNPVVGDGESQHFMGATYAFSVTYEVCQADYLNTADSGDALGSLLLAEQAWANIKGKAA